MPGLGPAPIKRMHWEEQCPIGGAPYWINVAEYLLPDPAGVGAGILDPGPAKWGICETAYKRWSKEDDKYGCADQKTALCVCLEDWGARWADFCGGYWT